MRDQCDNQKWHLQVDLTIIKHGYTQHGEARPKLNDRGQGTGKRWYGEVIDYIEYVELYLMHKICS